MVESIDPGHHIADKPFEDGVVTMEQLNDIESLDNAGKETDELDGQVGPVYELHRREREICNVYCISTSGCSIVKLLGAVVVAVEDTIFG